MRVVKLTKGQYTVFDNVEMYNEIMKHKWCAQWAKDNQSYYAVTSIKHKDKQYTIQLGRFILGLKKGDERICDHINHDTLDNRDDNIRIVSRSENKINQKKSIKGYKERRNGKCEVEVQRNYKKHYVGTFNTPTQARKARVEWIENYNRQSTG